MNRDPYAVALNNALNEVKKAYPNIQHSFIFSENGALITGDPETDEETMREVIKSFETIREKAQVIGNLQALQVNGKNGKLILSNIKDMYLALATSKKADKTHIFAITHVIIPAVLKTLETITPTTQIIPPKKLVVDTLSGFFAGNSVQIDAETLMEWTRNTAPHSRIQDALTGEQNMQRGINQVRIETFNGNTSWCKVKTINDVRLQGKNIIRIPQKLCKTLEIRRGDLVKVKPAL